MPARHKAGDNDLIARMNAVHASRLQRAPQRGTTADSPTTSGVFAAHRAGHRGFLFAERRSEATNAVVFLPRCAVTVASRRRSTAQKLRPGMLRNAVHSSAR